MKLRKLKTVLVQGLDSRWRHFYWQRRFMHPGLREWVSGRIARRRGEPIVPGQSDAARLAQDLRHKGLADLGALLERGNAPSFAPISAERRWSIPIVRNGRRSSRKGTAGTRHAMSPIIATRMSWVRPICWDLANDPRILDAMHHYFGCRPLISYLAAWWSYPTPVGPQQAENFHRDVDDWRFIKLFVYLTDVDLESGPHVYVRSSAGHKRLNAIRRYEDGQVVQAFGEEALAVQTAKSGSAFLENTFGLHKGTPVQRGTRLIFQAVYSLNQIPYGPARPVAPFAEHLTGDDAARRINRVYLS